MKFQRQAKILELVQSRSIETQENLRDLLRQHGFDVTQATVSRDIKELRLVKVLGEEGNYRYALGAKGTDSEISSKFQNLFTETVIKVDCAKNIVVVRCFSGMANAAAAAIDAMNWPEVVGSVAGDDTILLVMREDEQASSLADELAKILH